MVNNFIPSLVVVFLEFLEGHLTRRATCISSLSSGRSCRYRDGNA